MPDNPYLKMLLGGKNPASSSKAYSQDELEGFLRDAGWEEDLIPTMSAIGMAESSGDARAVNPRGEYSLGLWQINMDPKLRRPYDQKRLTDDPRYNAQIAREIYGQQGLKAWGAYTDNRYKKYFKGSSSPARHKNLDSNPYFQSLTAAAAAGATNDELPALERPEAPEINLELDQPLPKPGGKQIKLPESVTAPGVPLSTEPEGQGARVRVPVKQGMQQIDVLREGLVQKALAAGLDKKYASTFANEALAEVVKSGKNPGLHDGDTPLDEARMQDLYKHGYADLDIADPAYDTILEQHQEQARSEAADKQLKQREQLQSENVVIKNAVSNADKLAADLRWHFGVNSMDEFLRLPQSKQRKMIVLANQAAAQDEKKKEQGLEIKPELEYQNLMRAKMGLAANPSMFDPSKPMPRAAGEKFSFKPETVEQLLNVRPDESYLGKRDQGITSLGELRESERGSRQTPQAEAEEKRAQEELRRRVSSRSDVFGEEYKNFLHVSRSFDSEAMRNQFLDVKVAQQTEAAGGSARVALQNENAEIGRQERVASMGTGEYLSQAPKSVLSGFASAAGMGLKSIAALAKKLDVLGEYEGLETTDLLTYQLGDYITRKTKELVRSNPDLEQEFWVGKAPETVGQVAQFMLGAWATKSPRLAVVILGSGMTAGDAYDEVRARGGSDEEAVNAGLLAGALLGPTELIGMRGAIKALQGTAHAATLRAAMKTALREGTRDAIENALQEIGQEFGQGIITKNPRTLAQLREAGLLGAIGGTVTTPLTLGSLIAQQSALPVSDQEIVQPEATQTVPQQLQQQVTEVDTADKRFAGMSKEQLEQLMATRPKKGTSKAARETYAAEQEAAKAELARRKEETKETSDALKEPSPKKLDARSTSGDGREVGAGDAAGQAAREGAPEEFPLGTPAPEEETQRPSLTEQPQPEEKLAGAREPVTPETPVESAPAETLPHGVPESIADKDVEKDVEKDKELNINKPETKHEFSSTQVNLPEHVASAIKQLAARIPDQDLGEEGREDTPHATVKFGLHADSAEDVRPLVENEPPIKVKIGKISTFPPSESSSGAEVLRFEVESEDLHRLNKKIGAALPHTDTFKYVPHITLAYVKPGLAQKYVGKRHPLLGREITIDKLTFSGKNEEQVEIELRGNRDAAKVEREISALDQRLSQDRGQLQRRLQSGQIDQSVYDKRLARLTEIHGRERSALEQRLTAVASKPAPAKAKEKKNQPEIEDTTSAQTVRKGYQRHRKFNPETMDLTQAVRALGGIRLDLDKANKGELSRLSPKEMGTSGLVNNQNGISAEDMAMALAQEGYRGDWVKVGRSNDDKETLDVDPNAFIEAVENDARGIRKTFSHQRDVDWEKEFQDHYENDPDQTAVDSMLSDPRTAELLDLVESGRANGHEREQFRQVAEDHGLTLAAIDYFLANGERAAAELEAESVSRTREGKAGARTIQPATPGDPLDPNYVYDDDGNILFQRSQQLTFTEEGLTQELVSPNRPAPPAFAQFPETIFGDNAAALARLVESPAAEVRYIAELLGRRTAHIAGAGPHVHAGMSDLTTALTKLDYLRRTGTPLEDYLNQGNLFGEQLSSIQLSMVEAFDRHRRDRDALRDMVDTYLQELKRGQTIFQENIDSDSAHDALFQRAYHGSPHTFDRFSTEKIGTGEGAQAYGWGLYFAGKKEVAEFYQRKLSEEAHEQSVLIDGKRPWEEPDWYQMSDAYRAGVLELNSRLTYFNLAKMKDAVGRVRKELEQSKANYDEARQKGRTISETPAHDRFDLQRVTEALDVLDNHEVTVVPPTPQQGRTYEVELRPTEDEYLLWDKPLSEQSEKVKKALASDTIPRIKNSSFQDYMAAVDNYDALRADETLNLAGSTIYQQLERGGPAAMDGYAAHQTFGQSPGRWASQHLQSLGIRGIKYLDEGSRNYTKRGELPPPTYNYVIFHDADVSIEAMYKREPEIGKRPSVKKLLSQIAVEQHGHRLKLDPEAYELLKHVYDQIEYERRGAASAGGFNGIFNDPELTKRVINILRRIVQHNEQHAKRVTALARAIKAAADPDGTVILYTKEGALIHEGFHYAAHKGAGGLGMFKRHARMDELLEHVAFDKAADVLVAMGYPASRPALIVEEIAAYIWEGDYEKLGLSEEEAGDFLDLWFKSYTDKNGEQSLEVFERERQEAQRLIEAARAKNQRRKDVPSVERGRQGRNQEAAAQTEGGEESEKGPLFRREDERLLDLRQRAFRSLYKAKQQANKEPKGSVGGYFPRDAAQKSAPKAEPVAPSPTPPAPPPPSQPPTNAPTDQQLLDEVDRILADPQAKSYIGRLWTFARRLPRDLQRTFTAEFTPLRTAEQQLRGGKQRLDLAAKAELLPGATGLAELDLLRFQTRVVVPIAKLHADFNRYLLLRRIADRLTHDANRKRVSNWTVAKAEQGLSALNKKIGDVNWKRIEKAALTFQEEADATLRLRVDAGLISQQVYDAIKASSDFYAPFKVMKYVTEGIPTEGGGRRIPHTEDLIDRIKGIDDADFQLQDFLLTAAQQIYQTRILAEKNRFMRDDVATLAEADPIGEIIRRAKPTRYYRIEFKPAEDILGQLSYQRQPVEQSFIKVGRAIELAEEAGLTVKRAGLVSALGRGTLGGMESHGKIKLRAFTSEVIAHELGHTADVTQKDSRGNPIVKSRKVFGTRRDIMQRLSSDINSKRSFQKELAKLVDYTKLGGDAQYRASAKERFAEFVALYIHNPKKTRELAPTWTDHFELNILPNPVMKKLVEGLAEFFQKADGLPNILTPLKELDDHNYLETAIRRAFPDRAPQIGVRFGDKPRPGYKIVEYLDEGTVKALEVRDDFAKALEGLHQGEASMVARTLLGSAVLFKLGATSANLAFQPVNLLFADLPRAAMISRYGVRRPEDLVRFPLDWIYSFFTSLGGNFGLRSELYQDFMQSGAFNSTIQRELTPEAFKPTMGVGKQNIPKRVLSSVAKLGSAIEETSKILGVMRGKRLEHFEQLNPEQQSEKMREIASEVRRYSGSPDFWRHGTALTGKTMENLNLLFMFVNARIQGTAADLARLSGRTGGGRPATAAWLRLAVAVGIPALTLMLYNLDDDEVALDGPEGQWKTTNRDTYNQIPDWERKNYFMIPPWFGFGAPSYFLNDRGERVRNYWRFPKRDIVQLFANTIEAAVLFADKKEPAQLKQFAVGFLENLSPINISGKTMMERAESVVGSMHPVPKTGAEIVFNRDTFRHRKIVPDYIDKVPSKDLPAAEQYTRSTSETFVRLGKALHVSPLLFEHATRGFSAGLVTQFLPPKPQPGRSPVLSYPAIGPVARRFVRSESTAKESDNELLDQALKDAATGRVQTNREAYKLYQSWKKNPQGKEIDSYLEELNVDPTMGAQVLALKDDDDKNLSTDERAIRQLGVENGDRARYLRKLLQGKTEAERERLIEEWAEKGLASKNVIQQLEANEEELKEITKQKAERRVAIKTRKIVNK